MFHDTSSISLSPSICQRSFSPAMLSSSQLAARRAALPPGLFLPNLSIPSILLTTTRVSPSKVVLSPLSPYKTAGLPSSSSPYTTAPLQIGPPQRNSTPFYDHETSSLLKSSLFLTPTKPSLLPFHRKNSSPIFPSPLFCSSPTRAVPVCPLTPQATPPRCLSPITTPSSSRLLGNVSHSNQPGEEKEHHMDHKLEHREIVRIVGRRLFEEEEEGQDEDTAAGDKIGLLTFILDTERCAMNEDSTQSSSSISSSLTPPSPTPPSHVPTRLIDATQASILAKFPHIHPSHGMVEDVVNNEDNSIEACSSLLIKYPHLFASILGAGIPRSSEQKGEGPWCERQSGTKVAAKRRRSSEDQDFHKVDRKCGEVSSKKRKMKALFSSVMVAMKHKKHKAEHVVQTSRHHGNQTSRHHGNHISSLRSNV